MLQDEFGAVIIDDGMPLRRALPILTGIPEEDCYTQEGKSKVYRVGNREEEVRKGLGELGNWLEGRYGEEILAELAMQYALREHPDAPLYVYPSVRKTQGRAYRRMGGLVIQVNNPKVGPSGNAFDVWDENAVDLRFTNDPDNMTLDELREHVCDLPTVLNALY